MKELSFSEVQQTSLGVLKAITDVCDHQGFRYSLAYGTLIGAVRHHGFIPWDDDIDIWMPRPDYDRLMTYLEQNEESLLPYKALNVFKNKDYPHMITRIIDTRTTIDVVNEKECGLGVFVDVLVLDGVGNDYEKALEIMKKARKNSSLLFLSARRYYHFGNTKGWKKRLLKIPAFIYTHLRSKMHYMKKAMAMVDGLDYENSQYVGVVRWCTYSPKRETFKKEWFDQVIKMQFDKYEFYVTKHYHEVLTQLYGDYMQLPPEEDRTHHHLFTAYSK